MNALRNSLSVAWKDLQIILRDRGLLLIILLLPLAFGTMLSLMYTSMYAKSGSDEGLKIQVYLACGPSPGCGLDLDHGDSPFLVLLHHVEGTNELGLQQLTCSGIHEIG